MKKIIACLISLLMVLALVAACGAGDVAPPAGGGAAQPAAGGDTAPPAAGGDAAPPAAEEEAGPPETGRLVIYSPLTEGMISSMIQKFEAETGIIVDVLAMGTGEALRRIEAEAFNPQADILWSGTIGTVRAQAHLFDYFTSVNEDAFFPQYRNVEGNLTRFNTIPSVIMYNADLVGDIEIRGFACILNPAFRGQIAFADPAGSSSSFEHIVNMLHVMGDGVDPETGWWYVEAFIEQLDGLLLTSSGAVFRGVADGEYTIGLTFEQGAVQFVHEGSPVRVVYMEEGVIFRGDGVYIVNGAPNLHSARVFVDWMTSFEAQDFMNSTQFRRTIRPDVPETEAMLSMDRINVFVDDEAHSGAMRSEWLDRFRDIFIRLN